LSRHADSVARTVFARRERSLTGSHRLFIVRQRKYRATLSSSAVSECPPSGLQAMTDTVLPVRITITSVHEVAIGYVGAPGPRGMRQPTAAELDACNNETSQCDLFIRTHRTSRANSVNASLAGREDLLSCASPLAKWAMAGECCSPRHASVRQVSENRHFLLA
jgi:hypothetical protein